MSTATSERISVPVAKPVKHIPALQTVPLPDVHVGQEFPSLGWWWRIEAINRNAESLNVAATAAIASYALGGLPVKS
jgi:hypothetical protein